MAIAPPSTRSWATRIGASERREVLDDRLGRRPVDRVDEHRPGDGGRVVVGSSSGGYIVRVGHRPDHVGDRLGQRAERRERALARLGRRRRSTASPRIDELAVVLLGHERHRRAGHHVGDRRQLVGRGLGRGDEPGDGLGRRRQDEHPAGRPRAASCSRKLEPRHDAEVAAAAADRPEQVGLVLGVDAEELAVGGDDLGREQDVDRQAVLAHEVADAAAERDPADADRAGVAEPGRQAVLGGGRRVRRRRSGRPPAQAVRAVDVDVERVHVAQVEHDPAVDDAVAGGAVAAAADGERQPGLAGERR